MLPLRPVFVLAAMLFLAPSWARADFMYTFTNDTGQSPTVSGFFDVSQAAINSGSITMGSDITTFSLILHISPTVTWDNTTVTSVTVLNGPIKVDSSGNLVPNTSGSESGLRFRIGSGANFDDLILNVTRTGAVPPPNLIDWNANLGFEGESFDGSGSVAPSQIGGGAVPEPASVVLLASGAPVVLLLGWRRRRQQAQLSAAS